VHLRKPSPQPGEHSRCLSKIATEYSTGLPSLALSYAAGPGTKRNLDFRALFCDESRVTDLDCDTHKSGSASLLAMTAGTPVAAHLGGLDGAAVPSVRKS